MCLTFDCTGEKITLQKTLSHPSYFFLLPLHSMPKIILRNNQKWEWYFFLQTLLLPLQQMYFFFNFCCPYFYILDLTKKESVTKKKKKQNVYPHNKWGELQKPPVQGGKLLPVKQRNLGSSAFHENTIHMAFEICHWRVFSSTGKFSTL